MPRGARRRPAVFASLGFSDPDADAERLYALSQEYRSQKNEQQMLDAVNQLATRYPQNHWTEEAFFATGNYYWVNLDRDQRRELLPARRRIRRREKCAGGGVASHLGGLRRSKARCRAEIETYIEKFPNSGFLQDALYWLGRSAERGKTARGAQPVLRRKCSASRRRILDCAQQTGWRHWVAVRSTRRTCFAAIPDAPPLGDIDGPIPAAARDRWDRAQALRSIAFDASAELELRAGYAVTQSPRLLLEARFRAIDAQHYAVVLLWRGSLIRSRKRASRRT